MAPPAIEVDGLTKYYGPVVGVEDLSFRVEAGEVYGFLGANGAGKTTTMRLLLDLLRPTRGRAAVLGIDCHRDSRRARGLIGHLPGELPTYPDLTARGYLEYLARLESRPISDAHTRTLLERFDVSGVDLSRRLRDQSHGMKQKIGIIQALMSRAPVLILDEPTTGLDPLMAQAFRDTILAIAATGDTTVLLSSHLLDEVESTCTRIGLVRDGRMVATETIDDLRRRSGRVVIVDFASAVRTPVPAVIGVAARQQSDTRWTLDVVGPLGPLLQVLAALPVRDLQVEPFRLEDYIAVHYRGQTGVKPGSDPGRSGTGAGSDQGQTGVRPGSDRGRSGVRPGSDPGQAGVRPDNAPGAAAITPTTADRVGPALLTTLVRRTIVQARYVLLGSILLLCAFQLIIVGQASAIEEQNSFSRMAELLPGFLQRGLGNKALILATFKGTVAFGYFHPVVVVLISVLAVYLTTEVAHEVEAGLVDLELARAVPRHALLTRSVVAAAGAIACACLMMAFGTWAGLRAFASPAFDAPSARVVAGLVAHLAATAALFGAIGLALAGGARRWSTAFFTAALSTVVLYLIDFLSIGWPAMRAFSWISPFRYYPALSIIAGDAPAWRNLVILTSAATVFAAIGYWRFANRDL